MPPQLDYDKLAREHGGTPVTPTTTPTVDYDALAREVQVAAPAPAVPAAPAPAGQQGRGLFVEGTQSLNPVNWNNAIQSAFWHPVDTAKGLLAAQDVPRVEAMEAFRQGDPVTGTRKLITWLIPLLGPRLDEAADYFQAGDIGSGLGATLDVGINVAGPKVLSSVKSVPVIPRLAGRNPVVREAAEFGLREGVPVDVATATGNPFLRGAQRLSEESLLGSTLVSPNARAAQAAGLTRTGERLAGGTSPAPVVAEQAGQAVRDRVAAQVAARSAEADVAYGTLRRIEAKVPLPVDVAATKAAMRPIYDALKREAELVPLVGDKARALTALDRLMTAPDLAPLSVADAALGELKNLARVDETFRRTAGQGVAAEAVTNLDRAVVAAARQAGPQAFEALMAGRAATVNKFKALDALNKLDPASRFGAPGEPRSFYTKATMPRDAGIKQLRALAGLAPEELRQVGRAWLDEALTTATAEGGFSRAQGLHAAWQNLGPQTKQLLFGNAAHVKDLDNFFLLAKRMTENPNPSGSALTVFKGGELTGLLGAPGLGTGYTLTAPVIAKLLLSPTTTRLLLQGLRLPVSARLARATWAGQLQRALDAAGLRPLQAQEEQEGGAPSAPATP